MPGVSRRARARRLRVVAPGALACGLGARAKRAAAPDTQRGSRPGDAGRGLEPAGVVAVWRVGMSGSARSNAAPMGEPAVPARARLVVLHATPNPAERPRDTRSERCCAGGDRSGCENRRVFERHIVSLAGQLDARRADTLWPRARRSRAPPRWPQRRLARVPRRAGWRAPSSTSLPTRPTCRSRHGRAFLLRGALIASEHERPRGSFRLRAAPGRYRLTSTDPCSIAVSVVIHAGRTTHQDVLMTGCPP